MYLKVAKAMVMAICKIFAIAAALVVVVVVVAKEANRKERYKQKY